MLGGYQAAAAGGSSTEPTLPSMLAFRWLDAAAIDGSLSPSGALRSSVLMRFGLSRPPRLNVPLPLKSDVSDDEVGEEPVELPIPS